MKNFKSYFKFNGISNRSEYWSIVAVSIWGYFVFYYIFLETFLLIFEFDHPLTFWSARDIARFLAGDYYLFNLYMGGYGIIYSYWGCILHFLTLGLPPLVFFSWLFLATTVRRLADIGWSRWLCLVTFIPFIGNVFSVIIGVLGSVNNETGRFVMNMHSLGKRYSKPAGILLKYFTFEGRSNRQEYWVISAASCVFFVVGWSAYYATALADCETVFVAFVGNVPQCSGRYIHGYYDLNIILGVVEGNPAVLWLFFGPISLFSGLLYLSVATRRIRDIGFNPWIVITTLIPYLGVIPAIAIGALPSNTDLPSTTD